MPHAFWTEERTASLFELAPHQTASAIAALLGTTRNAVVGKAYRLGAQLFVADERTPAERRAHRRAQHRAYYRRRREARGQGYTPLGARPSRPGEPASHNLDLLDLTREQCFWPTSDDRPYLFCGHPSAPGRDYCPYHYYVAHNYVREGRLQVVNLRWKAPAVDALKATGAAGAMLDQGA